MVPGVLMNSLSEHYGSLGQLAEYKSQFRRAFRRLDDDIRYRAGDVSSEGICGYRLLDTVADGAGSVH